MFGRKKKKDRKHKPGMTQDELSKLEEVATRRGFFNVRKTSKHESVKKPEKHASRPGNFISSLSKDGDQDSIASSQGSASLQNMNMSGWSGGDGHSHSQNGKTEEEKTSRSVLEKASMYGDIVPKSKYQDQRAPMPVPTRRVKATDISKREMQEPIPPARRKSGRSSYHHHSSQGLPPPYNKLPEVSSSSRQNSKSYVNQEPYSSPVRSPLSAPEIGYSVPTPWLPSPPKSNSYANDHDVNSVMYDYPSPTKKSPMFSPPTSTRKMKQVVLRKRKSGDFGISLRRSSMIEHSATGSGKKRTVYFAEPGSSMLNSGEVPPLAPGDRLVAVSDHSVEGASRDEIVEMIKSAKDYITITVQSIPEAAEPDEIAMKLQEHSNEVHHAQRRMSTEYPVERSHVNEKTSEEPIAEPEYFPHQEAPLTSDAVFDETEWRETEKVWFVRKDGFSAAHLLEYTHDPTASGLQEGKVRIRLHLSGEAITVDEDRIEKANPEDCDRAEDISSLRFLNECGILHTLQQRYNGNLIHTYAGPHLISLSPSHQSATPSNKIMEMFKGCRRSDMPPHIFSAAQTAFSEMTSTGSDQSILMTGHSGSGKTQNVKNVLRYLTTVAGISNTSQVTGDKLSAVMTLLESFTGARTLQSTSASRSVNLYTLNFDRSCQVGSVTVQCMLLESSRVVRRPRYEENFGVFYQLVEGSDTQLSRELFLVEAEQQENRLLFDADLSSRTELWREEVTNNFKKLKIAMETLGFTSDETKAAFNVLAACLHLGTAGSQKVGSSRYQFLKPDAAQKASSLLGISIENLARAIFQPSATPRVPASPSGSTLQRSTSTSSVTSDDANCTGQENLEGFITGLYIEVFRLVVSVINRSLSAASNFNTRTSLVVVDTPGIQSSTAENEENKNVSSYTSLEDLAYNYVQERLQLVFHHNAFTRLQERYQQENVSCDFEPLEGDVAAVTDAIDHPPAQSRIGASNLLTDSKGLFWLLDEEALIPGATEESFIERLTMFFGQPAKHGSPAVEKGAKKNTFVLNHMMGSCPVEYDATNWLKLCRENSLSKNTAEILQDSKKKYISVTFGGRSSSGGTFQGSIVGMDNSGRSLTLRRGTSMRKAWTSSSTALNAAAVVKKKSLSMLKKLQVDSLVDVLKRTQIHFVFCFTPQRLSAKTQERVVDVKFLTDQLRGFQLLPATRVHKQGYPEHIVFSEFRRCYEVLCKQLGATKSATSLPTVNGQIDDNLNDKEAAEYILKTCDIERSQYRLGISQTLFRSGVIAQLEKRRNEKLCSVITAIQAQCRGYLARRLYEKRKVQVVAIRCIQRNFKKFLVVRQWPWWRLLTKVLPLVEVHRTEEDLREKEAELEIIKSRYEKVVSERDELKKENEKYEAQFNDVVGELSEEQATATHASEMLEQETRERIKLEREVKEMQAHNQNFRQRCEALEVELAEQRLLHSTERDGLSDSDDDADAAEYKMRYDRIRRETEFKHKKEMQEYEEKVEQAEADKKHAEKKLHQMQEDLEEQERVATQHKRKAQRTLAELNDARMHLEETNTKLHELEKKQRKFDSELYAVQAELTEMKTAKDRIQREKDQLSVEIYTKKNMLDENSGDMEALQRKVERLEQELEETTAKDSEDGQLLNSLKKQRRELEAKLKDQEEELDEQAGQIQMLQQAKERSEMNQERTRQQHSKELDSKEEELEEMRISYQKKIKNLDKQLEEEEEERAEIMKHRRELEEQLADLRNKQPSARRDAEAEKRLRKDLKRYKALLDDAQTMIDHLKTDAVNKQQLKQMRAQLEESQYTCSNAVKARKAIELELDDVQAQLDEISKSKQEAEEKISLLQREKHELNSRIEEDADDAKELGRKYKNLVTQQCEDRKEIVELNSQIDDHKREKETLNERILTLQSQLEYLQENTTDKSNVMRLESKVRDLETKLDFEKTSTRRLEVQLGRLKDQVEKLQSERDSQAASEHREKEQCKRLQKQLRDAKDEQSDILKREQEALQKQHELQLELMEYSNQNESLQADLKLAFKRISDLQIAFEDLEDSEAEGISGSDDDSDSDSDIGGSKIPSWRRGRIGKSRDVASLSTNSSRFSSKHSINSEEDVSRRKRAPSPEESKFSDSSTSTVRSFEKETEKERKERAKKTRNKLLKELKTAKSGDTCDNFDAMSYRSASVLDGSTSIAEAFARESDTSGRSTVMSKMSFGFNLTMNDTKSLCGDANLNTEDFDSVSLPDISGRPSSVMGMGGKYESKSGILSRVGKAGGKNAIKLELDRMSKSLADEDPSVLLYASPADISGKLGLGKTRSFRALNDNIMAVKTRQNLPEKAKRKLEIADKINGEISSMKDEHIVDKIEGRRSMASAGGRLDSYGSISDRDDDARSFYSSSSKSSKRSDDVFISSRSTASIQSAACMDRRFTNQSGLRNSDFDDDVRSSFGGGQPSRRISSDFDNAEEKPLRKSRFLKDFNFDVKSTGISRDVRGSRRQEQDDGSYFTDGEYNIPQRNHRRRTASASVEEQVADYVIPRRSERNSQNRDVSYDSWSMLDNTDQDELVRTSSRMSSRHSSMQKRTPPGTQKRLGSEYLGSRSSGSLSGSDRSSYSSYPDDDDVSLSQYGINDSTPDYPEVLPTRSMSRSSSRQSKIPAESSRVQSMRPRSRALSNRQDEHSSSPGRPRSRVIPHQQDTYSIPPTRGRTQSRTGRENLRSMSAATFQQRSTSVDSRALRDIDSRSRSSSRSQTRGRIQSQVPPPPIDDGDISIDSIINKYLYKP